MTTHLMALPLTEPADDDTLRAFHRADQRPLSMRYLQRLNWSREQLDDERRRRLRELVAIAQERSAWHRRRLKRFDARSLEEGDLSQFPVMTKEDVMANFDELVTDRDLSLSLVESHLGGRPISLAVVAAGSAAHLSRAMLHTFSDPASIRLHPVPITLPARQIVARLNEIQPEALVIYPSGLIELLEAVRAGELRIAPRCIITAGEPLSAELRRAAERAFATRVLNWWVSAEAGPMGIGCGHGPWMHLSDDLIIVEPVDEQGQPVPPGVRSAKVLLTVLYNHALPLIRYEVSDEVTVLEHACPCGSPHTLIGDVQGRRDDSLRYGGVVVHPHVFRSILGRARGIIEYRVIQTARGARVEIRGTADHSELRRRLTDALAAVGLHQPEVSIASAVGFERQATGKVKRFIPLPG